MISRALSSVGVILPRDPEPLGHSAPLGLVDVFACFDFVTLKILQIPADRHWRRGRDSAGDGVAIFPGIVYRPNKTRITIGWAL
jgi:hypothetical protein